MQPAQQAQVVDKEIDGMDVDQVVAADGPQCGGRDRVAARTPVAHAAYRETGFERLRWGHGAGGKKQAQGGYLHRVAAALQGNAQALDHALHATLTRKKLSRNLQDLHREYTSGRSAGRRAIQSRKRRRRRRGSNQMAAKIA